MRKLSEHIYLVVVCILYSVCDDWQITLGKMRHRHAGVVKCAPILALRTS